MLIQRLWASTRLIRQDETQNHRMNTPEARNLPNHQNWHCLVRPLQSGTVHRVYQALQKAWHSFVVQRATPSMFIYGLVMRDCNTRLPTKQAKHASLTTSLASCCCSGQTWNASRTAHCTSQSCLPTSRPLHEWWLRRHLHSQTSPSHAMTSSPSFPHL